MKEFDDFPEAFDYCRECGKPVIVIVTGEKWKLFPSGYATCLETKKERNEK